MTASRLAPLGDSSANPTASRHRLGIELRNLRQARSLRLEDVAVRLDIAPSTLSRIETGHAPTKLCYLSVMLDIYAIDDQARRDQLADLARGGRCKNWWADCSDFLLPGMGQYLDLEAAASHVRMYAVHAIPGFLQTRSYATACLRAARPELTTARVRKLTALQLRRQELALSGEHRLRLIVDESALLRSIDARVMVDQIRRLVTIAANSAVTLQVAELSRPTGDEPILRGSKFRQSGRSQRSMHDRHRRPGRDDQAPGRRRRYSRCFLGAHPRSGLAGKFAGPDREDSRLLGTAGTP